MKWWFFVHTEDRWVICFFFSFHMSFSLFCVNYSCCILLYMGSMFIYISLYILWKPAIKTIIIIIIIIINDWKCHLTVPIVNGCCARDALPHTFNIKVFNLAKNNSTITKRIHNESANLIYSCDVVLTPMFGRISHKPCQWFIGMEDMVKHVRLHYTRVLLDAGHIKPN